MDPSIGRAELPMPLSVPTMVSIMGACVLRVVWILTIFPLDPTLTMLYISYPISWAVTFATHFICYLRVKKKKYGV